MKQQLTLINLYPEDFQKELGKRGVEELIDQILDEMIDINRQIEQFKK